MSAISGARGMGYCYTGITRTSAKAARAEDPEEIDGGDNATTESQEETESIGGANPDEGIDTDPVAGLENGADSGSEIDPGQDGEENGAIDPDDDVDGNGGVDTDEDVDPDTDVDPDPDVDTDNNTGSDGGGTTLTPLAQYKKDFIAKLQATLSNPRLAHLTLDLNITDAGYTKMMNDENYEKTVLELFNKKASMSNLAMSGIISITADGKLENTAVEKAEDFGMARRLFGNSPRSVIRGASLDSMVALAQETITYREKYLGKFETASAMSATAMQSSTSYINAYLKKAGLLDTTG